MQPSDDTRSELLDAILTHMKNVPTEKEQEYIDSIINIITETEIKKNTWCETGQIPILNLLQPIEPIFN